MLPDSTAVHGYEIQHGIVHRDGGDPLVAGEGCRAGPVAGTVWHGLLENDAFRRTYLREIASICGRGFTVAPDTSFLAIREAKLDRLADLVADHLDQTAVHQLLKTGLVSLPTLRRTLDPMAAQTPSR
jgi:adenosylcobyric acid synthase